MLIRLPVLPPTRSLSAARRRSRWLAMLAAACTLTVPTAHTQAVQPHQAPIALPSTLADMRALVTEASEQEIAIMLHKGDYLRYFMHVVDDKGDNLRDVIETPDGSVSRTVEHDGKPVPEDVAKFEYDRLNDLVHDPSIYAKRKKRDQTSRTLAQKLIHQVPQAMIFTLTPGQPQMPGPPQIVLDFTPDPTFHPPDLECEALTGLRGRLWIDASQHIMVHAEGHIFTGVNFGWGMLAHLYPGGELRLDQTQIGKRWIFDHFTDQLAVRALLVKTLHISDTVDTSHYTEVPAMSVQDAAKLLMQSPRSR